MDMGGLYFTETEVKEYLDTLVISEEARALSLVMTDEERCAFIDCSLTKFLEDAND